MKGLTAVFVFILSLGLSLQSLASDPHSCAPESKDCAPAAAAADSHHGKGEAHHGLDAKMNSLFPGKEKNAALATAPAAVNTVEPKFLAVVPAGKVKLQWSDAKAPEYHLQVATDPNFKWLVVNEKFVKGTSFEVTAEAGKKYFWRVASFNSANDSYFTKSGFTSSAFSTK
jgi:hypothetical protein